MIEENSAFREFQTYFLKKAVYKILWTPSLATARDAVLNINLTVTVYQYFSSYFKTSESETARIIPIWKSGVIFQASVFNLRDDLEMRSIFQYKNKYTNM